MKAIGKCEVCGGKIIQAGNGNVFCEDCADKAFSEKLQEWADRREKQRIIRARFSEITTESDNMAFSWILQNDRNAVYPENNSEMIRRMAGEICIIG
jgi:uncharacterized Zn finger protein (UPF0148 family)